VTDPGVTFAGTRQSGYGVKGGPYAVGEFQTAKTIWVNLS
jgi:aldehyde dehydrogenase (NAD+)